MFADVNGIRLYYAAAARPNGARNWRSSLAGLPVGCAGTKDRAQAQYLAGEINC
jgi:hypothetical protein